MTFHDHVARVTLLHTVAHCCTWLHTVIVAVSYSSFLASIKNRAFWVSPFDVNPVVLRWGPVGISLPATGGFMFQTSRVSRMVPTPILTVRSWEAPVSFYNCRAAIGGGLSAIRINGTQPMNFHECRATEAGRENQQNVLSRCDVKSCFREELESEHCVVNLSEA